MVRDDFWRLDGGPAAGFEPIPFDGHAGPESTITPGDSYSLTMWFTDASDGLSWPGNISRYRQVLKYGLRAGQFALSEPAGGGVRFVETHNSPPDLPAGSLLVALRPPINCDLARGMWALVASVQDLTMTKRLGELEVEFVHLARLDRFLDSNGDPDFAACRQALEREGI